MPLHYYQNRILRLWGQIIGQVLRTDNFNIESATRVKFARIAVEIALNKPLVSQFRLDEKIQGIESESPFNIFRCGKYRCLRD